jgi:hypothetical protein
MSLSGMDQRLIRVAATIERNVNLMGDRTRCCAARDQGRNERPRPQSRYTPSKPAGRWRVTPRAVLLSSTRLPLSTQRSFGQGALKELASSTETAHDQSVNFDALLERLWTTRSTRKIRALQDRGAMPTNQKDLLHPYKEWKWTC